MSPMICVTLRKSKNFIDSKMVSGCQRLGVRVIMKAEIRNILGGKLHLLLGIL